MNKIKAVFQSAIVLYFIIGLEIMIMISPFAGFFYSVFNPFLLETAKYPATRWLSAFFLPHMVVPPDTFLKSIRVLGSILFVGGMLAFFLCALQVYANKFLKRGTALKGLYAVFRHPQYMMLACAGIGLSILWPRFLVAVLWLVMILLYYFLAKDEERRMLKDHPETYREYMEKTGMFLPRRLERLLMLSRATGKLAAFVLVCGATIGGAFALRAYTVTHLPLWSDAHIVGLAVNPDDLMIMEHRMPDILNVPEVRARLEDRQEYLVYFLPANYIMQGLIADTGGEWRLYKRHHTLSMITDWILHPFGHLTEGGHGMHASSDQPAGTGPTGMVRRLVFLSVSDGSGERPGDVFTLGAKRVPLFMLDVEVHTLRPFDLKELPRDTGWGSVPTPVF